MKQNPFPYFPFLISLFPILSFLSVNINQVSIGFGVRSAIFSLVIGIVLFGICRLILRNWGKAALIASWLFILFFSYGHVFGVIDNLKIGNFDIGRHRYLILLWGILAIAGCFLILKLIKNYKKVTNTLNIFSIILIAIPIIQMSIFSVKSKVFENTQTIENVDVVSSNQEKPDVYYIILDQYSRQDMLLKNHGFDNANFINALKDLGFYVAPCSQSNYSLTSFSLASSLNMNYLEAINITAVAHQINWTVFGVNIQQNLVQNLFKELGYKTITFESGVQWADVKNADIYITQKSNPAYRNQNFSHISEFEVLFWRTTLFRFFEDYNKAFWYKWFFQVKSPDEYQYDLVLFNLDQLEAIATIEGPKFVYLHLVSPHPPYVIDANGNYSPNPDHATGYLQQINYLDKRIPQIMDSIIRNSKNEPIIVIQADHGDEWSERMSILNAFYFPEGKVSELYPTITPVNTFRIIFDHYFNQNLGKLDDLSYLSKYDKDYYKFEMVNYGCSVEK